MKEEVDLEFPMIPTNYTRNKLVCGVGVNNAWYKIYTAKGDKKLMCPYYSKWRGMLERCYSLSYKSKNPTYKNVTACEEWHTFSNFRKWMVLQDWEGKHLDKDIVCPNNKVYSPETCMFVTRDVNMLLLDRGAAKGQYKRGVYYNKQQSTFFAMCCTQKGKRKYLGRYPTEALAYEAYVHYKHNLILEVAAEQEDHRVRDGLLLHAQILLDTLDDNE